MGKPSKKPDRSTIQELLREKIRGEVRFDDASRALYATDASNYRQIPTGVVIPKDTEDLIQAVAVCHEKKIPILARGGGTSVAGQCCNVAVILDLSKYLNRIVEINLQKSVARVQPGVVLDDLQKEAAKYGLMFGPDPSTHSRCTFGGMIGNDSCGVHSIAAGRTLHNVVELEILTYDGCRMSVGPLDEGQKRERIQRGGRAGQIVQELDHLVRQNEALLRACFPQIPRRVSGYPLDQLLPENHFDLAKCLVGSEGTCVMVLEATVRLIPKPRKTALVVAGFKDIFEAGDASSKVMQHRPVGLEGMDQVMIENMKEKKLRLDRIPQLPEGKAWLFVEFAGDDKRTPLEQAQAMIEDLRAQPVSTSFQAIEDEKEQKEVWAIREVGPGATVFVPGKADTWSGWEDSAVPPEKVGDYLRDLDALMKKYGYWGAIYGHFGDGCVHVRISFDLRSKKGIGEYRRFVEEAAECVVRYGGSLSGEHGDGQSRGELLEKMYGREVVALFEKFKEIWDPDGKMNPGKVVHPRKLDEDLRLPDFSIHEPVETKFRYPEDQKSFAAAVNRCVGIGKCRQKDSGVMCPSYKATLEEKHSPRGRAHLLYEMLQGDLLKKSWKEDAIKESLDLCLSCKACKTECPTGVDMATYKAEFLHHYYQGRARPLSAQIFGRISVWARMASLAPGLVNSFLDRKGFETKLKSWAGITEKRKLPRFAAQSFTNWFHRRTVVQEYKMRPEVILWPDTFNNYFYPDTLKAACEVLEHCGFRVSLPRKSLCCGRPLYDFGMLDLAEKYLRRVMQELHRAVSSGIPVVVLEPSCLSVFRDEMKNLFAFSVLAERLSKQIFGFSEFIKHYSNQISFPQKKGEVLIQKHCHEQSLGTNPDDAWLLEQFGLHATFLQSGCCGMAGAFGYDRDHYEISAKIAKQGIQQVLEKINRDTPILADGFSCREQIVHLGHKRPLHIAELIHDVICPAI